MTERQYDFDFMTNTNTIYSITSLPTTLGTITSPTYNTTATSSPYTYTINDYVNTPKTFKVDGDAEFKGDITVKGVKLSERLDEIEKRLAILRPNSDLENRWEELKELGEKYRELEREILEKEQVWDLLKK